MFPRIVLVFGTAAVVTACGPTVASMELRDGCQPLLGGADCMLPYPSDFFTAADGRVTITGAARGTTIDGVSTVVHDHWISDGASLQPSIATVFSTSIATDEVTRLRDDPSATLMTSSRTLIVHAGTGALVAHYVDVDGESEDPAREAVVLHPLAMLEPEQRYVVAFHRLTGVAAPAGFRRLRDAVGDPDLEDAQRFFDGEVFAVLDKLAVPRASLQMAWSFTTGTADHPTKDMLRVRDLALAWLAANTPTVTIDEVETSSMGPVWRQIRGTIEVPLFLTDHRPAARLVFGDDGEVRQNGTANVTFLAIVPQTLRGAANPGGVLGLGHGIFGDRYEVVGGAATGIANDLSSVMVSIDWWGLSMSDVLGVVGDLLGEPSQVMRFTDRVHQAMANWIVLSAAVRGPLLTQAAFQHAGAPVYDASGLGFIGLSVGHVLAGTLAALSPDIERFVLNVGGAGFTHLMTRARPFRPFLSLMSETMPDPLDRQKFIVTLQEAFDRIDGATYAPLVLQRPLPTTPANRQVLMQIGLGDTQVPNLASYHHARLLGIPLLTPTPQPVWGLDEVAAPHDGSAISLYDFGIDQSVYDRATTLVAENHVHDGLRNVPAVRAQMQAFFTDGRVVHACDGVCDPE